MVICFSVRVLPYFLFVFVEIVFIYNKYIKLLGSLKMFLIIGIIDITANDSLDS